jgi:hypothetical protein
MNEYRIARLLCQSVVLLCVGALPAGATAAAGERLQRSYTEAVYIAQQMVNEVCSTVPFMLGFHPGRSLDGESDAEERGSPPLLSLPLVSCTSADFSCLCSRAIDGRLLCRPAAVHRKGLLVHPPEAAAVAARAAPSHRPRVRADRGQLRAQGDGAAAAAAGGAEEAVRAGVQCHERDERAAGDCRVREGNEIQHFVYDRLRCDLEAFWVRMAMLS